MAEINFLSETFSSILGNIINYESSLTNISEVLTNNMIRIDSKNLLSTNFLDTYKNYPKYPYDFKVINSLNKYNLVTIYNIAQNDVEYLIDSITNSNILSYKNKTDLLPDLYIKEDYELQTSFFSELRENIFNDMFYTGFTIDKTRENYLFKTFGNFTSQDIKESSFIYHYTLYVLILKSLRYSIKLFESLYQTVMVSTTDNSDYYNSFSTYIDNNKSEIAQSFAKFILAYTYKISNPSGSFLKEVTKIIEGKIVKIKKLFSDFVVDKDLIINELALYTSSLLYNYIAGKFAISAADPTLGIISRELITSLKTYEGKTFDSVFENYTPQSIKDYLYLVYYYKLTPKKFLNVLQLVLCTYTKQNLVNYEKTEFAVTSLQSWFTKLLGTVNKPSKDGLSFNTIETLLREIVTPNYVLEKIEDEKLVEFATRIGMCTYMENFLNLNYSPFNTFIDEIYDEVFLYLKNTAQVQPYYEFYFNRKMMVWYLSNLIKKDILENKVFNKNEIQLSEIFYDLLTSEKYSISFDIEKIRSRAVQYLTGNITNISNLFENILETSIEKRLHNEHITYFFN